MKTYPNQNERIELLFKKERPFSTEDPGYVTCDRDFWTCEQENV